MNQTTTQLPPEKLKGVIHNELHKISNNDRWKITGSVIQSRQCQIFKAEESTSGLTLAIKHYSNSTSDVAPKQQYEAFQRCHTTMANGNATYRVPATYFINQKHRIFAMEWISGKSLHSLCWRPFQSNRITNDHLERSGRWLRHFHESGEIRQEKINFSHTLKSIEKQIERVGPKYHQDPSFAASYLELEQIIEQLPGDNHPTALLHGDFTPANLLFSEKRVTGLDIWATVRGSIYSDIARIMTYLSVAYPLAIPPWSGNSTELHNRLFVPFCRGYGFDLADPTSGLFRTCLLAEHFRRRVVIGHRPVSPMGLVTNSYQQRYLKYQFDAVKKQLGK